MADVFFRLSCKSFTIICFHANVFSFSFVDRQNTYSCKSDLLANFSAVYIFLCTLNSLLFTSVSSSRRCWSLDLVGMFSQPEREQKQKAEKNTWMSFNDPRNSAQRTLE